MTRRWGTSFAELMNPGSAQRRWWPMDDTTASTTAAENGAGVAGTWTGTHTRSAALWGYDDLDAGHTQDEVYSQYVTGASYVTVNPALDTNWLTANPWFWCFIQPDSDRGDCHVAVRPGVWHLRFNGSQIEILVVLTSTAQVSISAEYGDITQKRMVAWSFTDSDKKIRLYLDGELVAISAAQPFGITQSASAVLHYGGNTSTVRPNFRGYLDDFAISYSSHAIATDTNVRRLWMQLIGTQYPYFETFGSYPDDPSLAPGDEVGELVVNELTWSLADGMVEGPASPTSTSAAALQHPIRSSQIYFETAVWFPVNYAQHRGGGLAARGPGTTGDSAFPQWSLCVAGSASPPVVRFMSGTTIRAEATLGSLGIDDPVTRERAVRLGLSITHAHSGAGGPSAIVAQPFINGVSLHPGFSIAGTSPPRPTLLNRGQDVFNPDPIARFEYLYMDTVVTAPPPDFFHWVVGAIGSHPHTL